MHYYPQLESHIKDKVKVVVYLWNYATKKKLVYATGVDTSDLATKFFFYFPLKAQVDIRDTANLSNVPNGLNNFKTRVDDLDVGKLKPILMDFKKLSDLVRKEAAKNT